MRGYVVAGIAVALTLAGAVPAAASESAAPAGATTGAAAQASVDRLLDRRLHSPVGAPFRDTKDADEHPQDKPTARHVNRFSLRQARAADRALPWLLSVREDFVD